MCWGSGKLCKYAIDCIPTDTGGACNVQAELVIDAGRACNVQTELVTCRQSL